MKKKVIIALAGVVILAFANLCCYNFAGADRSVRKLAAGEELSLYECCSIYQLHLTMSICGFIISPEASRECLKLHAAQEDTVVFRHFNFRESKKMARVFAYLEDKPSGSSIRVSWNGNRDYSPFSLEHRAATALNPCTVTKVGESRYTIAVSTRYPIVSRTEFDFKFFKIIVNEGLFRYLQDRGWLSSYVAVYYEEENGQS